MQTNFTTMRNIIFVTSFDHLPRVVAVHCPLTGALLSPHRHRSFSSSKSFTQLVYCSELQSLCELHSRPFTENIQNLEIDKYLH